MQSALINHIRKFVELSDADAQLINAAVTIKTVKKKAFLLEPGHICKELNFVSTGCLRLYFINKKLNEQTTQFAIENWWMTDFESMDQNRPSFYYMQAVETTEVISITKTRLEELYNTIPKLERYFRIVQQRAFSAIQTRIKLIYSMGDEERYRHFSGLFPAFMQRVPQYMLASYLGFTPQFLSKIRAKIV
jgi:CRP/FNR family transcriptional regulator